MATTGPESGGARAGRAAVPVVVLLFGLGLAALATPRAVAHLIMLPGESVATALERREPVGAAPLAAFVENRSAALALEETADILAILAVAEARRAHAGATDGPDRGALERARTLTLHGLSRRPADARAWTRLVRLEMELDGATPLALAALRRSLALAPRDYGLMPDRLILALSVWPSLDDDMLARVSEQVRLSGAAFPKQLAYAADATGRIAEVRVLLRDTSGNLAALDRRLAELVRARAPAP